MVVPLVIKKKKKRHTYLVLNQLRTLTISLSGFMEKILLECVLH